MAKNKRTKDENETVTVDYRKPVPDWVRAAIDEHMGNDIEDAKQAGALGFMARALVMATMPYKDPKTDAFTRKNGEFRLRIVAGYEGGIPFGIYPRLLLAWVTTEAVRNQSPVIKLGDSLRVFLRDVMEVRSSSGGSRGTATRVSEQMKRLFGSLITAQYTGPNLGNGSKSFKLRNVMIADDLDIDGEDWTLDENNGADNALWRPQDQNEAGKWQSTVRLSQNFFQECIDRPVPIDLRAYKSLRGSPLAMDVYNWLTYRMSYTERRTRPIPWVSLMLQLGSNYRTNPSQAERDFRKAFLKALNTVKLVYPQAQFDVKDNGLVLIPSPTHIQPVGKPRQKELF